jgi:hypothetical protein
VQSLGTFLKTIVLHLGNFKRLKTSFQPRLVTSKIVTSKVTTLHSHSQDLKFILFFKVKKKHILQCLVYVLLVVVGNGRP